MPVCRFQCARCGIEATQVGANERAVVSVSSEEWTRRCEMAEKARAAGEPVDPLSVDCPYLKASARNEGAEAAWSR
jgi:hypothetical protein